MPNRAFDRTVGTGLLCGDRRGGGPVNSVLLALVLSEDQMDERRQAQLALRAEIPPLHSGR